MKTMYVFTHLREYLDKRGYPKVQGGSEFQIIKEIDFEEAYKSDSISFEDDGIYFTNEEKKYRGYMFIQKAYITYNGSPEKFPKFHLLKCEIIQDFLNSGRFKQRYKWSHLNVNNLIDKQTRKKYNDIKLDLCKNCSSDVFKEIHDTQDFFDKLAPEQKNIQVDIGGYGGGKEKISKEYRKRKNYTCENCSVESKNNFHKRWWHTHHIDGNKINNNLANLKCLCILCHSNVDDRHKENFSKSARQIQSFIEKYGEELRNLNNPYF